MLLPCFAKHYLCTSIFPPGANPPSSVSFIAVPENRTSLFFRWFRPEQLNVLHPFLLRYTLFYTTNTTADYDSDQSVSGLTTDANGVGTYFLTGLGVGVEYRVGIRAMSGSIVGAEPEYVVGVATYGLGKLLSVLTPASV